MDKIAIKMEQLQVGLFVEMPVSWLEHSFLRKRFLIADEKQVKEIQALSAKEIFYFPEKSTNSPKALVQEESSPPTATPSTTIPSTTTPAREKVEPREDAFEQVVEEVSETVQLECLSNEKGSEIYESKKLKDRKALQAAAKAYTDSCNKMGKAFKVAEFNPARAVKETSEYIHSISEIVNSPSSALHLIEVASGKTNPFSYHAINVSMLAMMVGKNMGLETEVVEDLGLGALLHDLGKKRLSDEVQRKKFFELTTPQKKSYHTHVDVGLSMVKDVPGFSENARDIIAQHHEFTDGSGFPMGLRGRKISELAQITNLCNIYDKLVNGMLIPEKLSSKGVISYIYSKFKHKIKPEILQLFVKTIGVYPPGTIAKLDNKQVAVVVSINHENLLKPNVIIYDETIPKNDAEIVSLLEESSLEISTTLKRNELCDKQLDYLCLKNQLGFQVAG